MEAKETMAENKQNKRTAGDEGNPYEGKHHTNIWTYCLSTGFFAGLIWGVLRWFFYEMKFTLELPGIMADPFFRSAFLKTGWGYVVGIGSYIVFSMIAALIYGLLLRKLKGPWPGVLYGLVWWAIIFLALGPLLHVTRSVWKTGWNTLSAELCVFLLWGVFIGYTIAFEFTDEASREPVQAS
ncbi:YqhR family membrane protein [Paenibacillus sp. KS-LC4]|uniref:YqhR family membrane protein n=1 Tax=Paenibacillus sp. KS-LC4 TaxID=2979727 RepID=UPI0030D344FB